MFVSIVQRHTKLTTAQKRLLQELSTRAARNFRTLDDVEWTITDERVGLGVAVRLRSRARVFRASANGANFREAARGALERALKQRRRAKRQRVDTRDDLSRKGAGGRRKPKRTRA